MRVEKFVKFVNKKTKLIRQFISSVLTLLYFIVNKKSLISCDPYRVPIVINNRNRYKSFDSLVGWLKTAGYKDIRVIDNASSYPALLTYYDRSDLYVKKVDNLGPYALWEVSELWQSIKNGFYVYTDADVVPDQECPFDVVAKMIELHCRNPLLEKIGLSLRIDDLPECYDKKTDVLSWEGKYWEKKIDSDLFDASVDTTFALYKPRVRGGWWLRGARTVAPMQARHTPWYVDSKNLDEEEVYYRSHSERSHSTWIFSNGRF